MVKVFYVLKYPASTSQKVKELTTTSMILLKPESYCKAIFSNYPQDVKSMIVYLKNASYCDVN